MPGAAALGIDVLKGQVLHGVLHALVNRGIAHKAAGNRVAAISANKEDAGISPDFTHQGRGCGEVFLDFALHFGRVGLVRDGLRGNIPAPRHLLQGLVAEKIHALAVEHVFKHQHLFKLVSGRQFFQRDQDCIRAG